MDDTVQEFVERMGRMLEAEGMPRIAGRIFGFLLVHEGAHSLDELAERLQVSKGSVSTNARLLEQMGVVERSSEPGDRRDYYRMGPEAWERMLRVAQRKWETMRQVLTEAAASLPEEMEVGRARLIRAEQFHLMMSDGVDRMIARWRHRDEEMAGANGPTTNGGSEGSWRRE
jgi:DNA-binding transcriptional regulator GbsR (MarR family)